MPVFSSRLIVMDNADFTARPSTSSVRPTSAIVDAADRHAAGLRQRQRLPDLTVNAPNPSLFGNTGERIFPGDADILHGQHLYRPESNDIDLYPLRRGLPAQHGVFTAETFAERLANSSSLDTVLSLYGDVTILHLPAGIAIQDGHNFTISDDVRNVRSPSSSTASTALRRAGGPSASLPTDTADADRRRRWRDAIDGVAAAGCRADRRRRPDPAAGREHAQHCPTPRS